MLAVCGTIFTIGSMVIVSDLITLGYRVTAGAKAADNAPASAAPAFADPNAAPVGASVTGWGRYLSGYEAGLWLLGMWFLGALITVGLLSFNLDSVQAGDPTLPYVLASTAYPGLLLVTLLFVGRFLASLESRAREPAVDAFALGQAA